MISVFETHPLWPIVWLANLTIFVVLLGLKWHQQHQLQKLLKTRQVAILPSYIFNTCWEIHFSTAVPVKTTTTKAPLISSTITSVDDESGPNSNATLDSILDSILKVEEGDTNATEVVTGNVAEIIQPPKETIKRASVIVSRGCRPVNFIESTIGSSDFRIKKYTQFCSTDLCNYGDGRNLFTVLHLFRGSNRFSSNRFTVLSVHRKRPRTLRDQSKQCGQSSHLPSESLLQYRANGNN